jgi:hypothetical protein
LIKVKAYCYRRPVELSLVTTYAFYGTVQVVPYIWVVQQYVCCSLVVEHHSCVRTREAQRGAGRDVLVGAARGLSLRENSVEQSAVQVGQCRKQ